MSISSSTQVALRGISVALLAIGLQVTFSTETSGQESALNSTFGVTQMARMATFDNAGETNFALSLNPQLENSVQRASDIVIYLDTSASQTGAYKRDSILTLKQLLKTLNVEDRVKIVAVDLDPVPLTNGFVDPADPAVTVAIENLNQRVALGSTDIELMLDTAAKEFSGTQNKNKNVVYIGDGMSRAGLLQAESFHQSVKTLVGNQISVSSYAIGPERDIQLMAALANHTGGNLYLDSDDPQAMRNGAIGLSQTVHGCVFWPQAADLDENIVDLYPQQLPPLRADRDSIVVGTLAERDDLNLQITGLVNESSQTMSWSIQPENSDVGFSFLPALMKTARLDNGVTLPTVGSAGLREYARILGADASHLSDIANLAFVNGDEKSAKILAKAALLANPGNADVVAMAATYRVQDDDPFGISDANADDAAAADQTDSPFGFGGDTPDATADDSPFGAQDDGGFGAMAEENSVPADSTPFGNAPQEEIVPDDLVAPEAVAIPEDSGLPTIPGQELPGQPAVQPPVAGNSDSLILLGNDNDRAANRLLQEAREQGREYILTEEDRIRVINERARKQVEFELKRARDQARTDPDASIERVKNVMEVIDQTSDLYADTRSELRYALESSLLSFRQRKLEYDDARERAIENTAISASIQREAVRLERDQEQLAELINRFNSLMVEGNYAAAEEVTLTARKLAPTEPAVIVSNEKARVARNIEVITELRRLKSVAFNASMHQVEIASVSFPGDPVLIFPDAEEWMQKRKKREKYQNIRLTGSVNEEKILLALEEPATLEYDETPWSEVEEELERQFRINIVLDQSARDDSLTEDEPITTNLKGIRLKNALRLMLKEKNATFIVRNEVLLIISLEDAEDTEYFVTNVYNVGDLVAPRFNPGGGMGGQQGGQGGQQGGQGGQQGGGGGGFGGGGGGNFCVQEDAVLKLGTGSIQSPAEALPAKSKSNAKPKRIILADSSNPSLAWNQYFSDNFCNPGDVRETVRQLVAEGKSGEVVSLIQGAMQNDQTQHWMYEAMVLAMQIADMPKSEVERALMSTVDLSDNPDDAMYAAQYMAVNGMEQRAIRMLRDFAAANPTRTEPYVIGLRTAQKINDLDGIMWATIGIFSQEWPGHPEIVSQAKYASDAIRLSLKKQGQSERLSAYEKQLAAAFERDCFINVSWTGDADIDLYVAEPGGTICSRLEQRTTGGGVSMGDNFSAKPGESGVTSEQYVLPKGFAGNYQLMVRRVWGEVTSGKVTVSVHNHYRSPREASLTQQVELDDKGAIVLFALDQGRRTEPLADHAIETVVKQQLSNARSILAQQIPGGDSGLYYGGPAAQSGGGGLLAGGGNPLLNNLAGNLRGGVVGYQPVITQIQEGSFMTVNHATTADRLFVMVSVSPTFSQISSISTFNILGDASTAQGIAQSGSQGGGGGGGNTGGNTGN